MEKLIFSDDEKDEDLNYLFISSSCYSIINEALDIYR